MELHTIHKPDQLKILRTKCKPFDFSKIEKKDLRALIKEMRVKMHEWHGIGLAATQVGRTDQLFVAQTPNGKFYALFNPRITKTEGKPILMEEGCLSVPGIYGEVPRYEKVAIEGLDQNGKTIKIKAWGLLAQVLQHETDHLHGILDIDKMKKTYTLPTASEPPKKTE